MGKPLTFLLCLLSSLCFGQVNDFARNFIADSLGRNGFRHKSVSVDSTGKVVLINHMDMRKYKKDKVLKLLGKPEKIDKYGHDSIVLEYALYKLADTNTQLYIYIYKNRVTFVTYNGEVYVHSYFSEGSSIPRTIGEIIPGIPTVRAKIKGKDTIKFNTDTLKLNFLVNVTKYLEAHMQYPEIEKEAMIAGTVYLSFIVGKDSSVTDVKIRRHVPAGPGLDKEALRGVTLLSKLILPFKEKGRRVEVLCTIPIRFVLR